jgi:hypothetical protein
MLVLPKLYLLGRIFRFRENLPLVSYFQTSDDKAFQKGIIYEVVNSG